MYDPTMIWRHCACVLWVYPSWWKCHDLWLTQVWLGYPTMIDCRVGYPIMMYANPSSSWVLTNTSWENILPHQGHTSIWVSIIFMYVQESINCPYLISILSSLTQQETLLENRFSFHLQTVDNVQQVIWVGWLHVPLSISQGVERVASLGLDQPFDGKRVNTTIRDHSNKIFWRKTWHCPKRWEGVRVMSCFQKDF